MKKLRVIRPYFVRLRGGRVYVRVGAEFYPGDELANPEHCIEIEVVEKATAAPGERRG